MSYKYHNTLEYTLINLNNGPPDCKCLASRNLGWGLRACSSQAQRGLARDGGWPLAQRCEEQAGLAWEGAPPPAVSPPAVAQNHQE